MSDFIDQTLRLSIWIYVSHILTWLSLGCLVIAFQRHVTKAYERLKSSDSNPALQSQQDQVVSIGTAIVIFSVCVFFDFNLLLSIAIGVIIFVSTPKILKKRRFVRYQQDFDKSLAESLATLASSLRAGLTLKDALVIAVHNCPAAFAGEIARVLKDYRFGKSIDESLDGVRKRVKTANANIAFGALIIGTQLGGKIPEILNRIVQTIREVDRVEGRLKALTAQGRAQGALLCSMPVVIFVGMYLFDRDKINIMIHNTSGQILLGMVVFLELIGIFVTMRVMKLKV